MKLSKKNIEKLKSELKREILAELKAEKDMKLNEELKREYDKERLARSLGYRRFDSLKFNLEYEI